MKCHGLAAECVIRGCDGAVQVTPVQDARERYDELSELRQRVAIAWYIEAHQWAMGLLGEAINEHRKADQFMEAFLRGDKSTPGDLADQMIREYLADTIQDSWDAEET